MSNLDKIPSRIKYYLLDYKDNNMNDYLSAYGTKRLHDLSLNEIYDFFKYATQKDFNKILTSSLIHD